ncbi:MAG TPA: dTMP kinase [Fibrobacteraceae bacterium]|nr:dTMP kinase [Fibrobacteraceae bacterium]
MAKHGAFFCLEGMDGSGKSTQMNLLSEELGRRGIPVVRIREPGGTEISEKIRNLILSPIHGKMAPLTELLLYNAARAQLLHEVVVPALDAGKIVLADRFAWSTIAYQGYGRQLDFSTIQSLCDIAVGETWPDHTFVLDIPVEVFRTRRANDGREVDRIEQEETAFFARVRSGYQTIAERAPERVTLLDGTRSPMVIQKDIADKVFALLDSHS